MSPLKAEIRHDPYTTASFHLPWPILGFNKNSFKGEIFSSISELPPESQSSRIRQYGRDLLTFLQRVFLFFLGTQLDHIFQLPPQFGVAVWLVLASKCKQKWCGPLPGLGYKNVPPTFRHILFPFEGADTEGTSWRWQCLFWLGSLDWPPVKRAALWSAHLPTTLTCTIIHFLIHIF